jgi:hypothetical protein
MSRQRAQRAEALLRAIVGIADAFVDVADDGRVSRVVVCAAPGSSPRQAARNVGSALLAGLGVRLAPELIAAGALDDVVALRNAAAARRGTADLVGSADTGPAAGEDASADAAPAAMPLAANGDTLAAHTPPKPHGDGPQGTADATPTAIHRMDGVRPAHRNGRPDNGSASGRTTARGSSNGTGLSLPPARNGAAAAADANARAVPNGAGVLRDTDRAGAPASAPMPEVFSVDVRRIDDKVRCHVTITAGGRRFAGAGEAAADNPVGMLNLVARVTTEAVRASIAAANAIQYDGARIIDLAERRHVLVALHQRRNGDVHAFAGAAPINDRIEDAAARAALAALREVL